MAAGRHDFLIEAGATWETTLVISDWDLTGYKARMRIQPVTHNAVDLTTENGHIVVLPAESKVVLTLSADDTAAMLFPEAVYDILLEDGAGTILRLLQGGVKVDEGVTR